MLPPAVTVGTFAFSTSGSMASVCVERPGRKTNGGWTCLTSLTKALTAMLLLAPVSSKAMRSFLPWMPPAALMSSCASFRAS